jgi:hypothetical protein
MVFFVLSRQVGSTSPGGLSFVWDILWLGIVYGIADALLLNVLPVLAVWHASTNLGQTESWPGRIVTTALALAASLFVTTAYHFGYSEFHGPALGRAVFGNMIMTLGYLLTLTQKPITALAPRVALHIASAVHGVNAIVTLPPHFK